jgi:hypothetical protein
MELRVWSTVVVEHDCSAAVENLLKNGDNRIKLEASEQEDMPIGSLHWCCGL